MVSMHPIVPPDRKMWILGAVALPLLGLFLWSVTLIRSTRAASLGFEHCSTWTLETSRHLGVLEEAQEKATGLLHVEHPEIEAASLDAALDRLAASRQEFRRRTQNEPDPYLAAVDRSMSGYLAQVDLTRRQALELARLPSGPEKSRKWREALESQAHLDHQHRTVLGSFQALAHYHKDMLERAIRSSQRNANQLSVFAAISILIAVAFSLVGGLAVYQRYRTKLVADSLRTLVDTIPDGVLAWDTQGGIHQLNPGMAALVGLPSVQYATGLQLHHFLSQDAILRLESAPSGQPVRMNLVHATGALRAVDARVGHIPHAGEPAHFAVIRDVSREVERERRMATFWWQADIGRRSSAIVKDLEYAMHPVLFAQEILKPGEGARPAQVDAWNTLHRASEHAALLLRQLTHTAAAAEESPDVRVFDLHVCLQEVVESFHLDRGTIAGIEVDLEQDPGFVRGPASLVRRSLELLIQRALDVAAGGASVQVFSHLQDGQAVVRILNPGRGESEAELARMFDPLYCMSSDPTSDGLGTFNAAETIQAMGGGVSVAPADHGRTEVTLTFPLVDEL